MIKYREVIFIFDIKFFRLNFRIEFLEKSNINKVKGSAIRGIIGEGLIENNCIEEKRNCEKCICVDECIVKNVLYKKYKRDISFIGEKEGCVFTVVCDDEEENYKRGDTLDFSIIVFSVGAAYIQEIVRAVETIGKEKGFEKNKYKVKWVKNYKNEDIYEDKKFKKERLIHQNIKEYIQSRLDIDDEVSFMNIKTNIRFKKNGRISDDLNEEDLLKLIQRRLIGINAFEGKEVEFLEDLKLEFSFKNIEWNSINRYSNRKRELLNSGGIKGIIEIENINRNAKKLLIAGEIINIGKMTSMGLGNYILY